MPPAAKTLLKPKKLREVNTPGAKGKFLCGLCPLLFHTRKSLSAHRRLVHTDQHTCLLCKIQLKPGEDIDGHMAKEHDLWEIYKCMCCDFSYADIKSLTEHMKSMSENRTPGTSIPIAKTDPRGIPRGLMSPIDSESNASKSPSPAPPEVIPKPENNMNLLNDAVENILKIGIFKGDQLVQPETWEIIVDMATKYVRFHHGKEVIWDTDPSQAD